MVDDRYNVMEKSFRISLEGIYMHVVNNDEAYNRVTYASAIATQVNTG